MAVIIQVTCPQCAKVLNRKECDPCFTRGWAQCGKCRFRVPVEAQRICLTFGALRGCAVEDASPEYLVWCVHNLAWLREQCHHDEYQEILRVLGWEKETANEGCLSYADYLAYIRESPIWQSKRGHRLKMDNRRCVVCNSPEQLNVHHRTYERLGNELMADLITLCRVCHKLFHANGTISDYRPRTASPENTTAAGISL